MSLVNRLRGLAGRRHLADDLAQQTEEEIAKMTPISIMVAGKTGSGKSTLINALFREQVADTGVGQPVTQEVQRLTKEGLPLVLYDTKGLELHSEAQHEVLTSLANLITTQREKGPAEAIDLVYYTLNSQMNRIEPFEIELINALAQHVPVILVLTQAIGQEHSAFQAYLDDLQLDVEAIIPVVAKPYRLSKEQEIPTSGLQDLVNVTLTIVPTEVQQAFINAQQIDLERKVEAARSWANRYTTTAFGVGFIPIPVSDAPLLVAMQIAMLAQITSIFGVSLDKAQIISLIAGIGGTGSATYFGKTIASSLLKIFPGAGTVSGGIISGTTASALTLALAYSYIAVLERITIAEQEGRDLPLRELQKLMNKNLSEQLEIAMDFIPKEARGKIIPEWLDNFLEKDKE